jgi:hypothetical protein
VHEALVVAARSVTHDFPLAIDRWQAPDFDIIRMFISRIFVIR